MDRDTAIEIKDVSKSYKSVKALRDISFNIRKGELFGLIGPCLLYTSDAADD